jgi:hypothetical protein
MKNLLLVVALLFSLPACAQISGFPQSPRFKDVSLTGSLTSTKACATGFVRIGPNFCLASSAAANTWTDAAACTARTFTTALPAGAKAVYIQLLWRALAGNAIATRTNTATFNDAAACAGNNVVASQFTVQEFNATVAGTILGEYTDHLIAPLTATNTFSATQVNNGGNGNADIVQYKSIGYFD